MADIKVLLVDDEPDFMEPLTNRPFVFLLGSCGTDVPPAPVAIGLNRLRSAAARPGGRSRRPSGTRRTGT